MKLLATTIFIFCILQATGQGYSKAEYFFDNDPGHGNGISVNLTGSSDTIEFTSVINTSSLTQGIHKLGFRVKNNDGSWGLNETRSFYIFPVPVDLPNVRGIEYFFDNDPGPGNATTLNFDSAVSTFTGNLLLPIGALPVGNHQLVIRVKNTDNTWSLMENRLFKVCTIYGPKSIMSFHVESNKVFFANQSTGADSTKWMFGDNTTDTVLNPIKTYAGVGNYAVKLISKNTCGADTLTQLVSISGLHRISGKTGSDTGIATISFDGIGFNVATAIKIIKNNVVYIPVQKEFVSSTRIIGYFNFAAADTGLYNAVVNVTGNAFDTLKNAYHIVPYVKASVFISGARGPRFARRGYQYRDYYLTNRGTEDAIMVPFVVRMGYVSTIYSPQIYAKEIMLDLNIEGIFQNTYQYLATNNISLDAMKATGIDTAKNRQLYAAYKIRIPAKSTVYKNMNFAGNQGTIFYGVSAAVQLPMYNSKLVLGNTESQVVDCMNSFLRKAVRSHLAVVIDSAGWNNCFYTAFDTLTKSIKAIAQNISKSQRSIPVKAIFSTLLAQISQCGASGLPPSINSATFNKIITDVTYNWIFWENIDSIGRPCFDTTENFIFPDSLLAGRNQFKETGTASNSQLIEEDPPPCQGLQNVPELLEQCLPFIKMCGLFGNLNDAVGNVFKKVGPLNDWACKINSGAIFCEKLCEGSSSDPNVKNGPGDNFNSKHINTILNNSYTILFENLATATANAAYVEIRDTIDKTKLDISTFQLGSFGWADSVVLMDANRTDYSLLKDLRPAHPNKLRVDFRLDTATGIAKWKFFTLDTSSLQLTINPSEGFLPPNVNGREGIGSVSFSIKPTYGVTSGTVVQNKASIVFDDNDQIITPVWEHIYDTTRPQSQVAPLPPVSNNKNFVVNWGGTDAHAGIAGYNVYYSVNDSLFKRWKSFTTATSDTFHGQYNKLYKFYSVAIDKANNFELAPDSADTYTTATIPLPLRLLSFNGVKLQNPNRSKLQWTTTNEINTAYFNVERSINGNGFTTIGAVVAKNSAGTNNYLFTDSFPSTGTNFYRLKQVDINQQFTYSPVVSVNFSETNELYIYPTIVDDYFIVSGAKMNDNIQIIDALGRVTAKLTITQQGQLISTSNLAKGVYWVKVFTTGSTKTIKIIKQ